MKDAARLPLPAWAILSLTLGATAAAALAAALLFDESAFMPHGHCYLWKPGLVWTHAGADLVIGVSYVVISWVLLRLVRVAGERMPFNWLLVAFGVFIVTCGATHFFAAWNLWHSDYWGSAAVKLICATASAATAVILPSQIGRITALIGAHRLAEERLERLERANRELEAFSYTAAHDLRAPLRKIDSFSELIEAESSAVLGDRARDHLARVRANVRRMTALIDSLIELSRIQSVAMEPADVDLAEFARLIIDDLRSSTPEREVDFSCPPTVRVRGDGALLRTALMNVLSNAWKFSAKKARAKIDLTAELRDGMMEIVVRDNGAGFDPAHTGRLFEPFARLHPAALFEGNGIGLATVRRILERHGGTVTITGAVEKGATVRMRFPV